MRGKAGNEIETGNGNRKQNWKQTMHQSLMQFFLHGLMSFVITAVAIWLALWVMCFALNLVLCIVITYSMWLTSAHCGKQCCNLLCWLSPLCMNSNTVITLGLLHTPCKNFSSIFQSNWDKRTREGEEEERELLDHSVPCVAKTEPKTDFCLFINCVCIVYCELLIVLYLWSDCAFFLYSKYEKLTLDSSTLLYAHFNSRNTHGKEGGKKMGRRKSHKSFPNENKRM